MVMLITACRRNLAHQAQWKSGNFLLQGMLLWGQKHSCQQHLCKEVDAAATNHKKKLKLLLHCTPKMYCITTNIRLFLCSLQKKV